MNTRAYVLIFFFWAVLTIVTPTLILLSESSKADFDQNGKVSEGVINARKMMTYLEKYANTPVTQWPDVAPAPAPALEPASRNETARESPQVWN